MLQVTKNPVGKALEARLQGTIDEKTNFPELLGESSQELHLRCAGVVRINSIGVKAWLKYFQSLRTKGARLKFFELSPPLVEQLSFISDFVPLSELGSVCAPFHCEKCKTEAVKIFAMDELKSVDLKFLSSTCPTCKQEMSFDEVPDVYFSF